MGRNALALLLAYVFPRTFTFAAVVVAARVLGAESFGAYGTAAAFATVLSILASLGMLPLLVREIARDPPAAPRLMRAAHWVKTWAGAAMLAALLLLARALDYPPEVTGAALMLGVGYWLGTYGENLSAYFHGVERMRVCTEASAAFGIVSGALGVLFVLGTGSLIWFSSAFAVGNAASLAWLAFRAPREVRRGAPGGQEALAHLVRAALPFAGGFVALTVYYKIDVLVLERLQSAAEVGLYNAAYRFVDLYHALVLVGVSAVFPRLSRGARPAAGGRGWWGASRTGEVVLLVSVPVAAALWLMRAPVVGIFGAEYAGAVPVLARLAPALPALALNLYGGYVLGAAGRMPWMAGLYLGALPLKLALLVTLVPRLGAAGAGWAVLAAEVSLASAFALVLSRVVGAAPGPRSLALAAGAGALVWPAGVLLGAVWAVPAYLLGTAALYWVGGAVSAGERRALRGALPTRRGRELPAEGG